MCNATASKACVQCGSATYCGKRCQRADWKTHKILCKSLSTCSPRPSEAHKLVILFPEDEDDPKLEWMPLDDKVLTQSSVISKYIGNVSPGRTHLTASELREFELPHPLTIVYRDKFLFDGSKPNKVCLKLADGKTIYKFSGPMIAMRDDDETIEDMTLSDFRHVIDHFREHHKPCIVYPSTQEFPGIRRAEMIQGLDITRVDITRHNFIPMHVPRDHSVSHAPVSPLSLRFGCPVRICTVMDTIWKSSYVKPAMIANLFLECDPLSVKWGMYPMGWWLDEDHCVAVSASGEELSAAKFSLMCRYATEVLAPKFNATKTGTVEARIDVLGWTSRKAWEDYYISKITEEMARVNLTT